MKIPQSKCKRCSLLMSAVGNGDASRKYHRTGYAPLSAHKVFVDAFLLDQINANKLQLDNQKDAVDISI